MSKLIVVVGMVAACATEPETETETVARHASSDVAFTNCDESIGVGLVDTAAAQALVPSSIIPVGVGTPVTPLVVRTAHCGTAIAGHAKTRSIVQVGLVIVPPATPGTIDNYTLGYATDDDDLADFLELRGIDVHRVGQIDYRATATQLSVSLPHRDPVLTITGTIAPAAAPDGSFVANWWRASGGGLVEMTTTVPAIATGSADLQLVTTYQPLVDLVGGTTVAFPVLQQFNTFASATMTVTSVRSADVADGPVR